MQEMRKLSDVNLIEKDILRTKLINLSKLLESTFNFGTVTRENNPKEYFTALVLNKINSISISLDNCLLSNDIFLNIYIYRYLYELYIKIAYIFSGSNDAEILSRLNKFFNNKSLTVAGYINNIDHSKFSEEFIENHSEKYSAINKFVHPNMDSMKLHQNANPDQQFEFIMPNIKLSLSFIEQILLIFRDRNILNLQNTLDTIKLSRITK